MTMPGGDSDALAGAIIQLATQGEHLGRLDARETSHYEEVASRQRELSSEVGTASTRMNEVTATLARHTATIDGLASHVAVLASQVTTLGSLRDSNGDSEGYQPVPAPRWWKLTGTEREAAVDRLRAWVEQIYRPNYGRLAAALPGCWERHPLCLFTLDWLSELWSALYLSPNRDIRTVAAQAEWHTRLLPAAAEQMASEAGSCQHNGGRIFRS
jgi:hypothetical protein